jgi:Ala-tRNA(Pro) deacylase
MSMNVEQFLQHRDVDFDLIPHRSVFDASHLAQTLHVSGNNVAKTVLLKADHGYRHFVAVLPASKRVSLDQLSRCLGDSHLELATEEEIAKHCPDCEVGVLPPFGSQYGLNTVMDESLSDDSEMVFEANNHSEAIRMKVADFRYIEQPLVCSFAK